MQPKRVKRYKVNKSYLEYFLNEYWFIPSDVLQRAVEANVWDLCLFRKPVLDIGIGNGKMSNFIFRKKPKIDVGIDLDERGLLSAKKTKIYKKVIQANAENMPFKDNSFNTVISNSTFEHIVNDVKAISEVGRVLKKNGLLYITAPSVYLQKWILEYEGKKDKVGSSNNLIKFNNRANHLHYRSLGDWKMHLEKNNLKIIFHKYYFPKEIALFWYKLFKEFTYKFGKHEVWSMLGNSKLTQFLPKTIIISYLKNTLLKKAYEDGFFVKKGVGAQLFIIAKKL